MAAPQWRPNYFCLLSFHQIIYSPVGPAEALGWVTSLQEPDRAREVGPEGERLI